MMYVYEFEFFEDEGFILAFPFELEPYATQGEDMNEAIEMAADLLKSIAERALIHREALPEPSYGHESRHGGQVMVIAVSASLGEIDAVRAADAAVRLGVSRGRVSNMMKAGLLVGFRKGRDSYVTVDSLNARLAKPRKAGRPRKELATA